jgi:hypothetical protein
LPFGLGGAEPALDLDRLVGVPAVVEEKDRADADHSHYPELERIAFALPLFGELLVEKIELQGHRQAAFR